MRTATTTRLLVLLLGAVLGAALLGGASADAPAPARRLVGARRLAGNGPSDLFNALLKDVAPELEKKIGHMKFKDYKHKGVKLTNLRTFDFDCSDGCLSGKISDDLKSVSLSVHKFSLRIHSRYKAKKWPVTLQGQCDFQLKDTKGSGGGTVASLSPFKLSGVHVDVDVGKLVPSCHGLSGGIINVMVHLFQDKIKHAIADAAESAIKDVLQGGGGKMTLFESLLAQVPAQQSGETTFYFMRNGNSCAQFALTEGDVPYAKRFYKEGDCASQGYTVADGSQRGARTGVFPYYLGDISRTTTVYYFLRTAQPTTVDLSLVIAEALGGD